MCDTCGHAVTPGIACRFCARSRRCPPCQDASCDYCKRETLEACDRAVCRWDVSKNGSKTPRDVWRTSWAAVHLRCDGCGRAYTQPAARVERHDCALCVNKTERLLYDFLRAATSEHVEYQPKVHNADARRYDFLVGSRVLVELDGPQHFCPVKTWKTGFDVAHADKDKEDHAVSAGYSVVRVLQTDVWEDANEWRTYVRDALGKATSHPHVVVPARREYESGIYARLRAGSFF